MFRNNYFKSVSFILAAILLFQPFSFFGKSAYAIDSLIVDVTANPATGVAPLVDVDLTAAVSGSASGDITYKFDCTSDASWEKVVVSSNTTLTALDLCSYSLPGTYTAKVRVERANLTFEGTTAIFVTSGPNLVVTLSADPSSGFVPLNNVDLSATVSGSATGDITYKFDCTNDGGLEKVVTTGSTSYTAIDLCNYPNVGNFTASVQVERSGLSFKGISGIIVKEKPTLQLSIAAIPASGYAPLNDVDLTAAVSGTVTGDVTYKFDCTNDGTWDRTVTSGNNSDTATDLCDYANTGVYTIKVFAERGGLQIQGTVNVVVGSPATLALDFSTSPAFGTAPLYNVDLTAYVSGSASGNITYKFDCTNDGTWDRTVISGGNSYTAFDLCNYTSAGVYTAKARTERAGAVVDGTASVVVTNP